MANKFDLGGFGDIAKVKNTKKEVIKTQEIDLSNLDIIKKDKVKQVSLGFKASTVERLKKLAKQNGVSTSKLADQIIRKALKLN